MTEDELKQLAERIVSGVATEEEVYRYNQLFDWFEAQGEAVNVWDEDKEKLRKSIQAAIYQKAGVEKPVRQMEWIRWVAAAVLIAAVSTASFFIFKSQPAEAPGLTAKPSKQEFQNDVAPGQEGAILTLANGKTIVLDSAANGSLAQQGKTELSKRNGQIVYATEGRETELAYNTMTTPRGRQYSLVLADGSKVWLNAASSITFPTAFTGSERKVSLTGEAYFEVAHHANVPFIVEKGEMKVEVLGTHFNVNAYDDEGSIDVTLMEGAVKALYGNKEKLLKPGQQAQIKHTGVTVLNDVDIGKVMAWKNGRFHFEGTEIGELMRQLSRWYDVDVVYEKKVADLFYAEMPRNTKLSDVLKALELTGKVKFGISGKKIIVLP